MKIAIVCHGNIARSQVLEHYLRGALAKAGVQADVFSCGLAAEEAYPNAPALLRQVQAELDRRGVPATVVRTPWSPAAAQNVAGADLVLVADDHLRADLLRRVSLDSKRVFLFYEYIGEAERDFIDTFDPATGKQDPARFAACFDELARIAELAAKRLSRGLSR